MISVLGVAEAELWDIDGGVQLEGAEPWAGITSVSSCWCFSTRTNQVDIYNKTCLVWPIKLAAKEMTQACLF